MKVMWDMWKYRDLTPGDESSYYNIAYLWFQDHAVNFAWSPLYTVYYGTLMNLSTHAYFVMVVHRIVVVLALALLVLAIMRRLLPPEVAWLIAAWWAILPINFDTAFTIHLFAVLPILVAWFLILSNPSPWARGSALAMVLVATVLVRNEYMLGAATLAVVCLWWEARVAKHQLRTCIAAFGVPLLLAAAVISLFYACSIPQFHNGLGRIIHEKHTVNMCQVYAFGFQQRHPEWIRSPWLDCPELMKTTFGKPDPTLLEMIRNNPQAVLVHVLWNISLTPSGIQLLLFNESSGTTSPDYAPVALQSRKARLFSILVGAVLSLGSFLLYRERHQWWHLWLKDRALGWLAMLSMAPVALLIIVTQRPRPSYLFVQGLFLMALTGMCCFAIGRHVPALGRLKHLMPALMIGLVLVAPSRYHSYGGPRALLDLYERLAPFSEVFNRNVFMVSAYPMEIHGYVAHNYFTNPFLNLDYSALDGALKNQTLGAFLDERQVKLLYVDESLWRKLGAVEMAGWDTVVYQATERGQWTLLLKRR